MVLPRKPREVVQMWLEALNRADSDMLVGFYAKDAIYLQMNGKQVEGRAAIHAIFTRHFERDRPTRVADNFKMENGWSWNGMIHRAEGAALCSTCPTAGLPLSVITGLFHLRR